MVFARTDPEAPRGKGIGVFIVPASLAGVSVAAKDHKMGQAGAWTADVSFSGVRVPREALVGEAAAAGYATAMKSLAHGRLVIAGMCVGVAARLIDESVTYARERTQGGHRIGEYQLVQAMLADSQTEYLAARALVLDAAERYEAGTDRRLAPSAAKYFASEAVGRIADRAVQIHGGSGYIRGIPVERLYRDVRLFRIYEGTQPDPAAGHRAGDAQVAVRLLSSGLRSPKSGTKVPRRRGPVAGGMRGCSSGTKCAWTSASPSPGSGCCGSARTVPCSGRRTTRTPPPG